MKVGCEDVMAVVSSRYRVPNGPSETELDQLVWSEVKSSLMVEIGPTGWSGLADQT